MTGFLEFCAQFGAPPANVEHMRKKLFWDPNNLHELSKQRGWEPSTVGVPLGEEKRGFHPTPALLAMLRTDKKVVVDNKAAWLFICGNDLLMEGVVDPGLHTGKVLVLDTDGNVLGYGDVKSPFNDAELHRVYVKNLLDIGDYLRRERT